MDVQTALEWCNQVITEVDLELYQWQTDLDMMSFAGHEIPLQLWTNDDPPLVLTITNLASALESKPKQVRVMHRKNGEWGQVGTAEIDPTTGRFFATLTEAVPELWTNTPMSLAETDFFERMPPDMEHLNKSTRWMKPLAHFEVDADGSWKQNTPFARDVPFIMVHGEERFQVGMATVGRYGGITKIESPYYNDVYQSGKRDRYRFIYKSDDGGYVECYPVVIVNKPVDYKDATEKIKNLNIENHPFFVEDDPKTKHLFKKENE